MTKSPFTTIEQKTLYEGFFSFREDTLEDKKGKRHKYNVLTSTADAVSVLPEVSPGKFLFINEFRYPIEKTILSCPGGRMNPNEKPIDTAKRELLEETGYSAKDFIPLPIHYPFPSITDQKVYLFLAKGCKKEQTPSLDPLEEIQENILSYQELKNLDFNTLCADSVVFSLIYHATHLSV